MNKFWTNFNKVEVEKSITKLNKVEQKWIKFNNTKELYWTLPKKLKQSWSMPKKKLENSPDKGIGEGVHRSVERYVFEHLHWTDIKR